MREGQAVQSSASIQNPAPNSEDSISIILLNGKLLDLRCKSQTSLCQEGLLVPAAEGDTKVQTGQIVKAVQSVLLERSPEVARSLSPTISRGRRAALAREALAAYAPTSMRIGMYLNDVSANEEINGLRIRRFADGQILSTEPIDWSDRQNVSIALPKPGAYVIELLREDDENVLNLFLMAVPASAFQVMNSRFQSAQTVCSVWGTSHPTDSDHTFLRAYLLSMERNQRL